MNNILVVVLVSTIVIQVINSDTIIAEHENNANHTRGYLQDTINAIKESFLEHYTRIQRNFVDAVINPLIVDVDDKVYTIIAEQNKTLFGLEEEMANKNKKASGLGPEYSHCVLPVAARHIIQEAAIAMKACGLPAEEFLEDYNQQMDNYVVTVETVSRYAYNTLFECLPESEDPTDEEISDAVICINYEQLSALNSLNLLENMLVSNQYNNQWTAESLPSEASVCIDEQIKVATGVSTELINKIDSCIAQQQSRSGNERATMEDLQDKLDQANTTLTQIYVEISNVLNDVMDSDMISDVIDGTTVMISGANESIFQMSESTFKIINETEANGSYGQCLVGVREKAQFILDQATDHLPDCIFPLKNLDEKYDEELMTFLKMLESERQNSYDNIISCLPPGSKIAEEEILNAVKCVSSETLKAQSSFRVLHQQLFDVIRDTIDQLDTLTYEAGRCVSTVSNFAGDQTGYLRFLLSQCIANTDANTQNPSSSTTASISEVEESLKDTMEELQGYLDRANLTLQHRFSDIQNKTNDAINNSVIQNAVLLTKAVISSFGSTLTDLGLQIQAKIEEAKGKNLFECVTGFREAARRILEIADEEIEECERDVYDLAKVYKEQMIDFLEQYEVIKDVTSQKVFKCSPSAALRTPTPEEIKEAIKCVNWETANGLKSLLLQEQKLISFTEISYEQAEEFSVEAVSCVIEKETVISLVVTYFNEAIDECMLAFPLN